MIFTSFSRKLRAFSIVMATGAFCQGASGSASTVRRTLSKVMFSSSELMWP